ncbi:hypothetical protein N7467_010311 [Penicillium canescens]|nr:hypothetical protein N7467_010311 [Penicillium canescens]
MLVLYLDSTTDLISRIRTRIGIRVRPDYNITRHGTGVYTNYAGNDLPNEEIFRHNLTRLRELKKKHDPDNIFRKWHNIKSPIDTLG